MLGNSQFSDWFTSSKTHAFLVITQSQATFAGLLPEVKASEFETIELPAEGKLTIKQVRALLDQLSIATTYPKRFIFIPDAERLLPAAANALLKTLEEASPKNVFILTSAYPGRLLPTIRSRCQIIRLRQEKKADNQPVATMPAFDPKRKEPLTDDETSAIAGNLLAQLKHSYNPNAHKSLLRLRDYYKAKAAGAGEKLASDALLASLVSSDTK